MFWIFYPHIEVFRPVLNFSAEFFLPFKCQKMSILLNLFIFDLLTFWHLGKIISVNILNFLAIYWSFSTVIEFDFFRPYIELFRPFKCQKKSILPNMWNFFDLSTFCHRGEIISVDILNFLAIYWILSTIIEFFGPFIEFYRPFKCEKKVNIT